MERDHRKYLYSLGLIPLKRTKLTKKFIEYGDTWFGINRCNANFSSIFGVAKELHKDYDLGIALARGGTDFGYVAQKFGFPVLNVKMDRMEDSYDATWKPIDKITEEKINSKRVVVFEDDVTSGRTLTRVIKEIKELNPSFMDLLLNTRHANIPPEEYSNYKQMGWIKEDLKNVSSAEDCVYHATIYDTSPLIPIGFRRIISWEDFKWDAESFRALQEFRKMFEV